MGPSPDQGPHEWFVEHRPDYATRTLDAEDAARFESHLPGCAECRRTVAGIEHDLRWLPMGAAPAAASAGLRRRIVEQVLERRRPRRQGWLVPTALAASALLAVAGWYAGTRRSDELREEVASQQAQVAALQDTLSIMRQAGRVLQASVDVDGTRGGILIFADEHTHRWNVVVHGLPPAAPGHRYQFWFVCGESPDSMVRGTEVAATPRRLTMFATDMPQPQACRDVLGAALTEEPVAGDQGPPRGKPLAHLML